MGVGAIFATSASVGLLLYLVGGTTVAAGLGTLFGSVKIVLIGLAAFTVFFLLRH